MLRYKPHFPKYSNYNISFGDVLLSYLELSDLNAIDISKKSGIKYRTILSWLSGDAIPSVDNMVKLCDCLKIRVDVSYNGFAAHYRIRPFLVSDHLDKSNKNSNEEE